MLWKFYGQRRPDFAETPAEGQESVWDYPRPPVMRPDHRRVRVLLDDALIAETARAVRILETASAPGFYIPPDDVDRARLQRSSTRSYCEWKGAAAYYSVISDRSEVADAAWSYLSPSTQFDLIAGFISFYPGRVDCYVDDERVRTQAGGYYGGWVTSDIAGPVKGEQGTGGW